MVEILDSTLREGEQTPYVNFLIDEKIEIARLLDCAGVDMIEAGDPSVSPSIYQATKRIAALGLKAEIVAHSLAIRANIHKALECGVDRVVVFYPTSQIHLDKKMRKSQEQAVEIITDHVRYARSLGLKVRYTPEDASRTDFEFLVRVCNAALEAGADRISFADTLGIMQPHEVYERIRALRARLALCKIDLHCHNDYGLALANCLAGMRGGADCIHTTVNGLGERTGIPDLSETVVALHNLCGETKYQLKELLPLSAYVEKVSGFFLAPNKPVSGANAFSHKSGVHTNGVLKDPRTYEPFDPAILGRERRIVIDKYTGKLAVTSRLAEYGVEVNEDELRAIVEEIKAVGDTRKFLFDADIIEIAERVMQRSLDVIPHEIHAMVMIAVESHVYTSAVVRRLKNFTNIFNVYEITGDYDISTYIKVKDTADLNNMIEALRAIPGIKNTDTRIVLKRHVVGRSNGRVEDRVGQQGAVWAR
ncbi:MAG TPA: Lrp/AsnC ligand binding domain-containing protein [Levilinea sp.]|nr:Lrp/AsnC ligand binding domain-containing protein [Levilinea sp.]